MSNIPRVNIWGKIIMEPGISVVAIVFQLGPRRWKGAAAKGAAESMPIGSPDCERAIRGTEKTNAAANRR